LKELISIIELADRFRREEVDCALATVVSVAGSSYRRIGARLLVGADGTFVGGISGGCLEGDALRRARQSIFGGRSSVQVYDTLDSADRTIGIGLGCNGRIEVLFKPIDFGDPRNPIEVLRQLPGSRVPQILVQTIAAERSRIRLGDLYLLPENSLEVAAGRSVVRSYRDAGGGRYARLLERVRPAIHLVVVGTNYDILPTVSLARRLGWRVTHIGARRKFSREVVALTHRSVDYSAAAEVRLDDHTALVCMSHDYERDRDMLRTFLPRHPTYLGVLGPRKRTEKLAADLLREDGLDLLAYPKLYAPVGLDIGAETPEEIALALCAGIVAAFRDRPGRPLRQREGPIYPR
jgi:xanthine/CO dehydrogenase XdhC/CoxF family maturation factor